MGENDTLAVVKWVVFLLACVGVIPLSAWLRRYPRQGPLIWFLMGIVPFLLTIRPGFDIALISWAQEWPGGSFTWPGYVKGAQISALDLLAAALYFSLPRSSDPLPFRWPVTLYFVAVLLSATVAREPMAALFYAWQYARMLLVYVVVARGVAADARFAPTVLAGMAAGLCIEAIAVVLQKYALGMVQPPGTFSHQNSLGMALHFVVLPCFALVLAGNASLLVRSAPVIGAGIAAMTASRGTAGLLGLGLVAIFVLSALRGWTSRKAMVGLVGALAVAALAPIAFYSFNTRIAQTYEGFRASDLERSALEASASAMLDNNPFGVGANNFALVAGSEGYSRQARVLTDVLEFSVHVHNAYWLAAAETGYFGFACFLVLILTPMVTAFLSSFRYLSDIRGDLLLGVGVALLIVYIHSLYEWIFYTYQIQYLFSFVVAISAGTAQQLGYWRRTSAQGYRGVRQSKIRLRGRNA
ncbi:hypothetical protein C2U70_27200 [Bradyrhizobium guangdongense]|nr:hypothetical protein C2U70_27200 [Bradyrhizobium guangdongense]